MAATRVIQTPVWETRDDGPDPERQIQAGDWRDADVILELQGATVYTHDENSVRADVDWDQGWWLQQGDRESGIAGAGTPPAFIRQAFENGLLIYGVLVLRDQQRHN